MIEYIHFTDVFLTNQAASSGGMEKVVINVSPRGKETMGRCFSTWEIGGLAKNKLSYDDNKSAKALHTITAYR